MIDCNAAFERLFDFLDGEVDAEFERRIRDHFDGCKHCFDRADFERRFLAAVQTARAAQGCPRQLRERVLSSLRAEGWQG